MVCHIPGFSGDLWAQGLHAVLPTGLYVVGVSACIQMHVCFLSFHFAGVVAVSCLLGNSFEFLMGMGPVGAR